MSLKFNQFLSLKGKALENKGINESSNAEETRQIINEYLDSVGGLDNALYEMSFEDIQKMIKSYAAYGDLMSGTGEYQEEYKKGGGAQCIELNKFKLSQKSNAKLAAMKEKAEKIPDKAKKEAMLQKIEAQKNVANDKIDNQIDDAKEAWRKYKQEWQEKVDLVQDPLKKSVTKTYQTIDIEADLAASKAIRQLKGDDLTAGAEKALATAEKNLQKRLKDAESALNDLESDEGFKNAEETVQGLKDIDTWKELEKASGSLQTTVTKAINVMGESSIFNSTEKLYEEEKKSGSVTKAAAVAQKYVNDAGKEEGGDQKKAAGSALGYLETMKEDFIKKAQARAAFQQEILQLLQSDKEVSKTIARMAGIDPEKKAIETEFKKDPDIPKGLTDAIEDIKTKAPKDSEEKTDDGKTDDEKNKEQKKKETDYKLKQAEDDLKKAQDRLDSGKNKKGEDLSDKAKEAIEKEIKKHKETIDKLKSESNESLIIDKVLLLESEIENMMNKYNL